MPRLAKKTGPRNRLPLWSHKVEGCRRANLKTIIWNAFGRSTYSTRRCRSQHRRSSASSRTGAAKRRCDAPAIRAPVFCGSARYRSGDRTFDAIAGGGYGWTAYGCSARILFKYSRLAEQYCRTISVRGGSRQVGENKLAVKIRFLRSTPSIEAVDN